MKTPSHDFAVIRNIAQPSRDSLRLLTRTARLLWGAGPWEASLLVIITGGLATLPALTAWATKVLIDAALIRNFNLATRAIVLLIGLQVGSALMFQVTTLLQRTFAEKVSYHISVLLLRKASEIPDLVSFETPAFYDELRVVQAESASRSATLLNSVLQLLRSATATLSFGFLLWRFHPLVPVVAVLAALPRSVVSFRAQSEYVKLVSWQSSYNRRRVYYQAILTSDVSAKEVRMFSLGPYVIRLYQDVFAQTYEKLLKLLRSQMLRSGLVTLLAATLNGGMMFWVIWLAVKGAFTIGDVALFLQTSTGITSHVEGLVGSSATVYESMLFVRKLFSFLDRESPMAQLPANPVAVPTPISRGIEFRNVSYVYPQGKRAVNAVSLTLRPGEVVALVGKNGSGKSTLVKLLCRLYDPTEGEILVDGNALGTIPVDQWRQQIAVVFQDFNRYQLTVRQNIGFGDIAQVDNTDRLQSAANLAGAMPLIDRLPNGFDQQLGRQYFEGGVDLSGGEWQKLALSRAFLRTARVLVCDEPAGALDPEAEAELHERLMGLSEGKITLVISHRMSSVKSADRILVMEDGCIVEEGDHASLLALGGRYADMYQLQASRFS